MASASPHDDKEKLQDMAARLERMEKLVTRRFDEISAEIHATCEMLDMAETGIGTKFTEILAVLSAVTFRGDGSTPHNVGVELDAVVKTTEDAANRILDSAEAISGLIKAEDLIDWGDAEARKRVFDKIKDHTDVILTACAFQDLTGQRIGKTLENIRRAESELTETLKKMGINLDLSQRGDLNHNSYNVEGIKAASQGDIDKLFG